MRYEIFQDMMTRLPLVPHYPARLMNAL